MGGRRYLSSVLAGFILSTSLAMAQTPTKVEIVTPQKTLVSERPADIPFKEKPDRLQCIYVPGWKAVSTSTIDKTLAFGEENEINCLMIDVKNANGEVFIPNAPDWARAKTAGGHKRSINIDYIQEQAPDTYLIARHVMFRDKALYNQDLDAQLWRKDNEYWVDMRDPFVRDYNLSILQSIGGFDEIVLDYIRFPATSKFGTESEKCAVIDEVVAEIDRSVALPFGVQVFGYAAWHHAKAGVGQRLPTLAPHVDVVWPMIYPSHFWKQSFGYDNPSDYPYEFISMGYEEAVERVEGTDTEIRPMLQAFWYQPDSYARQLDAVDDQNVPGYCWWNPSGKYDKLAQIPEVDVEKLQDVVGESGANASHVQGSSNR